MLRHIIHIHIPAFPITIERASRPELRDRPVAVAPVHSGRTIILSVSSEAKREGVFKGMALGKALKFCPDLTVLPPNPGLTEKGCRILAATAARYTPVWEPSRPGHIHMDITGTERLWGMAKDTASRIKKEIKSRLALSGTVCVAGNKMVSSIASMLILPEGVLDVDHGQEAGFVAPLKVDILPGIGHVRRRVLLEELNITLIREIAALDMHKLQLAFCNQAFLIHQRSLGIDPSPVCPVETKPIVCESVTLPKDENDDHRLLGVLYIMVEKCAQQLRKKNMLPRKAGLMIRYADQVEVTRQATLPRGSFWDFDLHAPLERLFFKACQRRTGVRFLRIWFRDLSFPSSQISLFSSDSPPLEKRSSVIRALDRIRKRYGDEAIQYGNTSGFPVKELTELFE